MNELLVIMKGLGTAAASPLAFVAYIVAVISWAFLRSRVERNKNLLQRLTALPAEERGGKLSEEMGTAPIQGGLSPEQWIRAKTHHYYFLGFVILAGVVVLLFAISAYESLHRPGGHPSTEVKLTIPDVKLTLPDPELAVIKSIGEIDIGVQEDFVVSKLGQPRHLVKGKLVTCTDYEFPFAKLQFWVDRNNTVIYMYVVATSPQYHPSFFSRYKDLEGVNDCLGCFSFHDASREGAAPTPDNPHPSDDLEADDPDPPVTYFNMAASFSPTVYVEKHSTAFSWMREVYLVNTSEGVDNVPTDVFLGIIKFMDQWGASKAESFGEFFKGLPPDQRRAFSLLRSKFRPNAYALLAQDAYEGPQVDGMQYDVKDGEIDSVRCY